MRLALITITFLLHSQIAAAASTTPVAPETPANNINTVKTNKQAVATRTHLKLQPGQEAVRMNAGHRAPQIARQADQRKLAAEAADEADDLSYGTLLATLMLMAAIAVRRLKAGRP